MQGAIRSCLTAGIALVGVGVITVAPVAPQLPEIQVSSMPSPTGDGSASADPAGAWLRVFEHGGFQNLTQFGTAVADDSGLRQLVGTQFDYSQMLANGTLVAVPDLTQLPAAGLPAEFQTIVDSVAEGDVVSATAGINSALLGTTLVSTQVLLDVLSIPVQITDKITNVVRAVVSLDTLLTLLVGAVGPIEAVITAAIDSVETVFAGLSSGDTEAAVAALIAAPGTIGGAFLNGYTNDDGFRYPGIFTVDTNNPRTGGLLQTLLVTLPRTILTALGLTPTSTGSDAAATQEHEAALPEPSAPSPAVKIARSTHAASAAKVDSAAAAAPTDDTSAKVPTTAVENVAAAAASAAAAVIKGGNKDGTAPKRVTAANKASDGSPAKKKSTGSRSSRSVDE